MERTVETEGARYSISTGYNSKTNSINVYLGVEATDWKKSSELEAELSEHNFPFVLRTRILLTREKNFGYNEKTGMDDIDYESVTLFFDARSKEDVLYRNSRDVTGRFVFNVNFSFQLRWDFEPKWN